MIRTLPVSVAMVAALSVAPAARAQDAGPIAFFAATSDGEPGTWGADGTAFPACSTVFSDELVEINEGVSVRTPDGTSVVLSLPDVSASLLLRGSSEVLFRRLPVVDNGKAVVLILLAGRAYVSVGEPGDQVLVMAGQSAGGSGYVVSTGASISVGADPTGVTIAVLSGDANYFPGDVPAEVPLQGGGESVSAGQHRTTQANTGPVQGIPDALSSETSLREITTVLYQCGLHAGSELVGKAEKGDITPESLAAAAPASVFPPRQSTQGVAFDQALASIVAATPTVSTSPIRVQIGSPVRALLTSTNPASVIIGQRLRRTRIIGGVGSTGGAIRVNPNAEQLIRLPGQRR